MTKYVMTPAEKQKRLAEGLIGIRKDPTHQDLPKKLVRSERSCVVIPMMPCNTCGENTAWYAQPIVKCPQCREQDCRGFD